MRVVFLSAAMGMLCLVLSPLSAKPAMVEQDQSETQTTDQLQSLYLRLFKDESLPNQESVPHFLQTETTLDWLSVDGGGHRHSRAEQLQVAEDVVTGRANASPPSESHGWAIDDINIQGNMAFVRSHQVFSRQDHSGKYGTLEREHFVVNTVRYHDTWVKTTKGWRWKLHEESHPELSVDGKLQLD